jgi:tetratricopeptide (TPR) repeat protein
MTIKRYLPFALLALIALATACSNQKNTAMSRGYHNLTAHFNVYFNGNESLKEGEALVITTNKNDYTRILPVFEYSDPQNTAGVGSQMDRAIEKGVMLVAKHSITKKPKKKGKDGDSYYQAFYDQKDFNKWVDDAYLMMGKAHFYKRDFDKAIQAFDLVIRDYPTTPSRYEAYIWRASAYAEKADYTNAVLSLESYDALGHPLQSLYGQYMAVYADILLKQQKYPEAIPYLKGAIEGARKKDRRIRYGFILAQVYEETGNYAEAQNAYLEVRKMRPPYEMAFNANINRVSIVVPGVSTDETKRSIARLLRDKRNLAYKDRIYFALANVNQAEGNIPEALANLRKSTELSTDNVKQKAMSFLRMGDIYYDLPKYKQAFLAYDSAMVYLPETDGAYAQMKAKHESLQQLVAHIDTKERQDSLQNLANMTDEQRLAQIDKIIFAAAQKQEEEKAKQMEMQANEPFDAFYNPQTSSQQNDGKWYFYNLASVGMGKAEFERKWGRRKLEDNWRRSNKMAAVQVDDSAPGEPGDFPTEPGKGLNTLKQDANTPPDEQAINNALTSQTGIPTREQLMKDIPLTPEMMAQSTAQTEEALLGIAVICRDKLTDYPMAVEALLELLKRYPQSENKEEALIELYRTYELMGNADGLADVKRQLAQSFPDGKFTKYVTDPLYVQKMQELQAKQSAEYEATYLDYLNGNHFKVIEKSLTIETSSTENQFLPKYRLLKALSYAREAQLDPFKSSLEVIKVQHPNTEEAEVATAFLAELEKGRIPVKSVATSSFISTDAKANTSATGVDTDIAQTFAVNPSAAHSVVVWLSPNTDIKRLRFNMADFNFGNYIIRDFELALHKLPDNTMLFEVKGFEKQSEAMEYFYTLRHHPEVFLVDGLAKPMLMAISEPNLKYVVSSGNVKEYFPFFIQVYLRSQAQYTPMANDDYQDAVDNLSPDVVNLDDLEKQRAANAETPLVDGYNPSQGEHWYALVYNATGVNHVQLQNMYKGFISLQKAGNNLAVSLVDLKPTKKVLLVKGFASQDEANSFAQLAAKNPVLTGPVRTTKPEPLVISPQNFEYLMATGKIEEYKQFIKK